MTEELVAQAMEEANAPVVDEVAVEEAPVEAEQTEQVPEETENAETPEDGEHEEVFSKKALNAIEKGKRQYRQQKAINRQMQAELAELKATVNKVPDTKADQPPNEDDYATYGEYLKADARFEALQVLKEQQAAQQPAPLTPEQAQQQAWVVEREDYATEKSRELNEIAPDYAQVLQDNGDLIDACPPELERLVLALDNAPLAIYNLAKEGQLESLANMPLQLAAVKLHEAQGRQVQAQKKVTSAPKPMSATKGSGTLNKSYLDMSPDELLKRFNPDY